ncbi:MAG: MerR family transcriptional regulator [Polyangiaceae bacterium]
MAALAKESGVPSATIKHYIREGLLPAPPLRTSRNMAYYDVGLVPRIRTIKALQSEHFLPLKVIRDILAGKAEEPDEEHAARAIQATLNRMVPARGSRTRARLVAAGLPERELDFFRELGLVKPIPGASEETYEGDDLELLRTLGRARRAGITPDMLPFTALEPYAQAIRALVGVEVELLRSGILPRAGKDLEALLDAATILSERLVVLLRRRMILPTLRKLASRSR